MSTPRILMIAAENDSLPGAKVGGVADVLRDLPSALIKKSCAVDTVIPSYGMLAKLADLEVVGQCEVWFAGRLEPVTVLKRAGKKYHADTYILDSPLFSPQGERVYCHDGDGRPFATDATKFALFSASVATALVSGLIPKPDILHCHDWHSAILLVLIRFAPDFSVLQSIRTIYSVHNLAMQGVRPFSGDASSFEAWFPGLHVDASQLSDPAAPHCINPMRAGVNLADKVHTVSSSYAKEILLESDLAKGVYGGEGLQEDLRRRAEDADLVGILNGCEYPRVKQTTKPTKSTVIKALSRAVVQTATNSQELLSVHWMADKRLQSWAAKKKPGMMLTSVGRITDQKASLYTTEVSPGVTALSALLKSLGSHGVFVMIGSGNKLYEQALIEESAKHENFIFINGFAAEAADLLYRAGDLFVMPSSFEPCGISQLLAMRAGQPCLVNRVGGLRDTVVPNKTGFAFEGSDKNEQAKAMVVAFEEALRVFTESEDVWERLCKAAAKARFTWAKSVDAYMTELYEI